MDKYCSFKHKNTITNNVKCLLSASLFYLKNSYKNVGRYINGLTQILRFLDKNKDFALRLYYDNSIFDNKEYTKMYKILKNNKNVDLVNYKCCKFTNDNNCHVGTFGTLIRLLPMFDVSDKYEYICIIDIDDPNYQYLKLLVNKISKINKNVFPFTFPDYSNRYLNLFDNKFGNTIISNMIIKNYKFDIQLLYDFLDSLLKDNNMYDKIHKINLLFFDNFIDNDVLKTYGIDEYFINKYLINDLNENQIHFIVEPYYFDYFFDNLIILKNDNDILKRYLTDIISVYDQKINSKHKSNYELFAILKESIDVKNDSKYKQLFFDNYFEFCDEFKKITKKYYYGEYYYIFNEIYIDNLFDNNFKGFSWYVKKNFCYFPEDLVDKLVI